MMIRKFVLAVTASLVASVAFSAAEVDPLANPPTPAFSGQTGAPVTQASTSFQVDVLATGLAGPRSLEALPDGNLLVVDGKGEFRLVFREGGMSAPLEGVPPIRSVGGRGLMDITLDSDFANNRLVYMAFPAPPDGEPGGPVSADERTRVLESGGVFQVDKIARARLKQDNSGFENVEYLADLPARRLVHSSDGKLYLTTMGFGIAFANADDQVQKLDSLVGKMLRINDDGSIPEDNPFYGRTDVRQEIYSLGHRDPDGAMIHPDTGELWTIEHGPMGGDELNHIRPGRNYGWPEVSYGKNYDGTEVGPSAREGIEQPLYYWFPSRALSGLIMYTGDLFPQWQGDIFIGTMSPTQGRFLMRLEMDGERVTEIEHLLVDRDRRVRDVTQGPDGAIYVLTDSENNTDLGRVFSGEVLRLSL